MIDWPWKNFSPDEFRCQCGCGQVRMDVDFMNRLQALREAYDAPMIVSSGYRCPEHNNRVSSTGRDGPHTTGRAADITVMRAAAYRLLSLAPAHGFTGLGVQQRGTGRFIHLDDLDDLDDDFPRPTVWSY